MSQISPETKICSKCGETKNVEEFYFDSGTRTKRRAACKRCISKQKHAAYVPKKKDWTGKRIALLTFIRPTDKRDKNNHYILWEAKCDCGNEALIVPCVANCGRISSCGCLQEQSRIKSCSKLGLQSRKYEPVITSARQVWKNHYGDLDNFDLFYQLSQKPCHYCGAIPSTISNKGIRNKANYKASDNQIINGNFIYNGIDRVDNTKSHTPDNIVPCCQICNYAKRDNTVKEFLDLITRIHLRTVSEERTREYTKVEVPVMSESYNGRRKYHPIISSALVRWRTRYSDGCPFDIFFQLSQQDCYYCGQSPNTICNMAFDNARCSEYQKTDGTFIYNGLDRLDSSLDHSPENVVPCCSMCNRMKLDMTVDEFLSQVDRIYFHSVDKKQPLTAV